ncbi:MAG: hypothetical protein RM347_027980 [Nostoc sp. ChiQUE02]|uniref:hypothetical protein n=1 Tax=Nostoc sp. ChiQUE02 TaxID=3075377 RepID=UPI002AD2D9CC|nr:hypothetical protein [Nostoc sp. ChiQUE02]
MQLLLCIDVIANPKNSELFALCKCGKERKTRFIASLQGAIVFAIAFPFCSQYLFY